MHFYGNKQKNNITFAEKKKTDADPTDASNCTVQNKSLVIRKENYRSMFISSNSLNVCLFVFLNWTSVLDQDTSLLIVISYSKTPNYTHLWANDVDYV